MIRYLTILFCSLFIFFAVNLNAQFDVDPGVNVDLNGDPIPNLVIGAMSFLRLAPDAQSGGMGHTGIASQSALNAMHFNPSKLAFVGKKAGFSMSLVPWSKGNNDTRPYIVFASTHLKLNNKSTWASSFRYYNPEDLNFITSVAGNKIHSRELEASVAYIRKFSNHFSMSGSFKYLYSDLANGIQVNGFDLKDDYTIALDLAMTYQNEVQIGQMDGAFRAGLNLSNLGPKISYTSLLKDHIPTNFGLGLGFDLNLSASHQISFIADANKLMIPTPAPPAILDDNQNPIPNPGYDANPANGIADHREKSFFSGMIGSWTDAPRGFAEEKLEVSYSVGIQYTYNTKLALRTGYYYEHPFKGNRQFITLGAGYTFKKISLDVAYLKSTSNTRNIFDNRFRFSLSTNFDFAPKSSN